MQSDANLLPPCTQNNFDQGSMVVVHPVRQGEGRLPSRPDRKQLDSGERLTSMKATQVFAIIARKIPEPIGGQVRIRVHASGVSHSDVFTKEGPVVRN
jgi:hypothetical protein